MEPHTPDPRCVASPDPRPETGAPNLENDAAQPHPSPNPQTPTPNPAPRASNARRLFANRANAAKSTGPTTPEGKSRSSQNAIRHGLLSEALVLEAESAPAFQQLVAELYGTLEPANPVACILVDNMVAARWRQVGAWTPETDTLDLEIRNQNLEPKPTGLSAARAFRDLADNSKTLRLLDRYETRYDRQFTRSLRLYRQLNQPDKGNFQTNPIPNPNTAPPAPSNPIGGRNAFRAGSPGPALKSGHRGASRLLPPTPNPRPPTPRRATRGARSPRYHEPSTQEHLHA